MTLSTNSLSLSQDLWWGVEETFADLFAHLKCTSHYNGNLEDKLCMAIMPDYMECSPEETRASIGLHGAYYTVMF